MAQGQVAAAVKARAPALAGYSSLQGWSVLATSGGATRTLVLGDTIGALLADASERSLSRASTMVANGAQLRGFLEQTLVAQRPAATACWAPANGTARTRLEALRAILSRLQGGSPEAVARTYRDGVLPLDREAIGDLRSWLTEACVGVAGADRSVEAYGRIGDALMVDPLQSVRDVLAAADRVAEEIVPCHLG